MTGPENSSSAGYRAACFHRSRPVLPAGLSFAFAGRGELLMLLLPFKAMLPLGHARKSGGPPLFEPSFKVQRENAHNQSSGITAAPGLEGLNARGPLKVHPKWRLRESAQASLALLRVPAPRRTRPRGALRQRLRSPSARKGVPAAEAYPAARAAA